jgi:hypothetical protein
MLFYRHFYRIADTRRAINAIFNAYQDLIAIYRDASSIIAILPLISHKDTRCIV